MTDRESQTSLSKRWQQDVFAWGERSFFLAIFQTEYRIVLPFTRLCGLFALLLGDLYAGLSFLGGLPPAGPLKDMIDLAAICLPP